MGGDGVIHLDDINNLDVIVGQGQAAVFKVLGDIVSDGTD